MFAILSLHFYRTTLRIFMLYFQYYDTLSSVGTLPTA